MKIIAFASQKGGSGKSTLAVNVAGALALKGQTVLSDEDEAVRTAQDWLTGSTIPVRLLSPDELPTADTAYWVMDIEGRPELADVAELSRRALVLIPTAPHAGEMMPMVRMWKALEAMGAEMGNLRVVVTKAPPVGGVGQAARDELRQLGLTVCQTIVRSYTAHQRALEHQLLVRDAPSGDNAWADVVTLALEVS